MKNGGTLVRTTGRTTTAQNRKTRGRNAGKLGMTRTGEIGTAATDRQIESNERGTITITITIMTTIQIVATQAAITIAAATTAMAMTVGMDTAMREVVFSTALSPAKPVVVRTISTITRAGTTNPKTTT
ncbi:MAG: hypothetical protein U0075_15375 [Thermomicrobiales bacterium]